MQVFLQESESLKKSITDLSTELSASRDVSSCLKSLFISLNFRQQESNTNKQTIEKLKEEIRYIIFSLNRSGYLRYVKENRKRWKGCWSKLVIQIRRASICKSIHESKMSLKLFLYLMTGWSRYGAINYPQRTPWTTSTESNIRTGWN